MCYFNTHYIPFCNKGLSLVTVVGYYGSIDGAAKHVLVFWVGMPSRLRLTRQNAERLTVAHNVWMLGECHCSLLHVKDSCVDLEKEYVPGVDPGFQVRGAHLNFFGVFRVKNPPPPPRKAKFCVPIQLSILFKWQIKVVAPAALSPYLIPIPV